MKYLRFMLVINMSASLGFLAKHGLTCILLGLSVAAAGYALGVSKNNNRS